MPENRKRITRRVESGNRHGEVTAAIAAIVILASMAAGAIFLFSRKSNEPGVDILVGADVTGSVHQNSRQKMFGVLDETVDEALPHGSQVILWSFDVNAHKFCDITPTRSEDLWPAEDEILSLHPATYGTYPATVLKQMQSNLLRGEAVGRNGAIILLTDGEDQNPASTEAELKQMAKDPGLKALWICGVTSRNGFRSLVERDIRPVLGSRLIVSGKQDSMDALQKFRYLIGKV